MQRYKKMQKNSCKFLSLSSHSFRRMKHQNKEIRQQFAKYLQQNIGQPTDWDEQELGKFSTTPTMTILIKYFTCLVSKYREGEIYEAIHQFYRFNGSVKTLDAQIGSIKGSSKTKSIENFFRGKSIPSDETLLFIAKTFQMPIQNLADFEKYLQTQPPAKENKVPQATPTKKSYNQQVFMALLVLLLLIVSIGFYQAQQQLNQIDSLIFKPRYVGAQIEEKDTTIKKASLKTVQLSNEATANSLIFFTNNIYNTAFLHSKQVWSFQTDPKGEDMNSEYGEPYRREIKPIKKEDLKGITLANNEIWIRFNLQNKAEGKLFIDNLNLKIIAQYPINEQVMTHNAWTHKFTEKHYEVLLNRFALSYPMATLIEIEGGESKHFSLKVKNDKENEIENQIVKFRIIISANDGKGKRYTIQSDKDYFLGFMKK